MDTYQFSEQLSIDTPEQVALAFPIAGLGSRILAGLVDMLIHVAVYTMLTIVAALTLSRSITHAMSKVSDTQGNWILAGFVFVNFALVWGYYTLFEALWNGQTPGKRIVHIRVIKDSGRQITMFESMARNFVRIIDALPTAYIIGIVSILFTRENKRLGDLLGGTIVVRAEETAAASLIESHRTITASPVAIPTTISPANFVIEFPAEALARLSNHDLVLVESFFARIPELDAPTTERIAEQLRAAMCRKMQIEVPAAPSARRCLDSIAYSLRGMSVYR